MPTALSFTHTLPPHRTHYFNGDSGADPGFFLGGGALVSCSTSTPINHIIFFLQNTSCIRKPQVISEGRGGGVRTPCTLPLDPPLRLENLSLGIPYHTCNATKVATEICAKLWYGNERLLSCK